MPQTVSTKTQPMKSNNVVDDSSIIDKVSSIDLSSDKENISKTQSKKATTKTENAKVLHFSSDSSSSSDSEEETKQENVDADVDEPEITEEDEKNEPILQDNPNRFVLFPLQYPKVWQMYKKHEASFWTAEEIDLSDDMRYWEKLNSQEKHFIKYVLAFFAARCELVSFFPFLSFSFFSFF